MRAGADRFNEGDEWPASAWSDDSAAVVAADVAAYDRLMRLNDERTLADLKSARRTLILPAVTAHRGRIVKTVGDEMLLEFPSAVEAAQCAVEVQRGMAEQNASIPPDERVEFRIGIHLGDVMIDDDDIFGDGVNIAARLEKSPSPAASAFPTTRTGKSAARSISCSTTSGRRP